MVQPITMVNEPWFNYHGSSLVQPLLIYHGNNMVVQGMPVMYTVVWCVCVCACSYNKGNTESIESECLRLKSCIYHEETASTCSVFSESRTLVQPARPHRLPSSQLTRDSDGCGRDVLHNSKTKTKSADALKARY